jgi:hypothetical protein
MFIVVEVVCKFKPGACMALFSNNQLTVLGMDRRAPNISVVTGQLVCTLTLRMKKARVSPITPLHIQGAEKSVGRCAVAIVWEGSKVALPIRQRLANHV